MPYPSISTIAFDLNLSVSTIKRAVNDLIKAGYLTKEHRFRQKGAKSSNLYTLKKYR
ncbi:helix-turn-helix domain-containing protein [Eubacteriales bacterium OttesenSCG-928-G02]|nr:helix-turn-helix domain-containing protein [Eubacteriales bacterium OttesenSCG-928-G02]